MKSKETKRKQAEERHEKYNALTPKQKIARLNKGKFRALKERKRLGFPEAPKTCVN